MKFQFISDIHLESRKKIPIIEKIKDIDNLFLLGDIGIPGTDIYVKFMDWCSKNYKNVFIIYGNHEYYNKNSKKSILIDTMLDRKKYMINFCNNIFFLDNSCVFININNKVTYDKPTDNNYIKIIGSTLWSNIDIKIAQNINDYNNNIFTTLENKLTPYDTIEFFNISKKYILNEINTDISKCILLTHHGAHDLCNGSYSNSLLNSAYVTNIPELLECKNLLACINGHTHSNIDFIDCNIRFLSNCMGYLGENKSIVKYNTNAFLNVK